MVSWSLLCIASYLNAHNFMKLIPKQRQVKPGKVFEPIQQKIEKMVGSVRYSIGFEPFFPSVPISTNSHPLLLLFFVEAHG